MSKMKLPKLPKSPLTSKRRRLQVLHLTEGDHQRELLIADVQLEERPPADDLQRGEDNARDVDVADQHVAGHLANVLQEAQVKGLVLQPGQLEVAVDVGAVGVAVAQVVVVVLAIRRH